MSRALTVALDVALRSAGAGWGERGNVMCGVRLVLYRTSSTCTGKLLFIFPIKNSTASAQALGRNEVCGFPLFPNLTPRKKSRRCSVVVGRGVTRQSNVCRDGFQLPPACITTGSASVRKATSSCSLPRSAGAEQGWNEQSFCSRYQVSLRLRVLISSAVTGTFFCREWVSEVIHQCFNPAAGHYRAQHSDASEAQTPGYPPPPFRVFGLLTDSRSEARSALLHSLQRERCADPNRPEGRHRAHLASPFACEGGGNSNSASKVSPVASKASFRCVAPLVHQHHGCHAFPCVLEGGARAASLGVRRAGVATQVAVRFASATSVL